MAGHDHSYKYPVVPNFDYWRFPYDHLPVPWSRIILKRPPLMFSSAMMNSIVAKHAVAIRDRTCPIIFAYKRAEAAHIAPSSENACHESNVMKLYNR
ncbi:hypothetical protein F4779DRAFT_575111 [Xylariaceae sp. FL0662B]|nr:hypothetical protein F4779DRAFT_575111 [Xylariaceae sp. FL0662B]